MFGLPGNGLREHPVWEEFTRGYLEAALSTGPEGWDITGFARAALDRAIADTNDFIRANRPDLEETGEPLDVLGRRFWLTRSRLVGGFPPGRLAVASYGFGQAWLQVGDDHRLHFSSERNPLESG